MTEGAVLLRQNVEVSSYHMHESLRLYPQPQQNQNELKHKPQRIPLTAAKPPSLPVTGRERRLTELDQPRNFLEVSTERKIEINESQSKRTDKINLGFIPDCADKKQGIIISEICHIKNII